MTKRKPTTLLFGMASLFLFTFVFFGYLIISSNGNPIKESIVKRKIETYQNENFPLIEEEFKKENMTYDKKNRSYQVTYTMKENSNLSFQIIYDKDENIKDTYQTNIEERKELLEKKK